MGFTTITAFAADHASSLAVAATALATAAVHVPVRGRAVRDRWRRAHPGPSAGVRITAASAATLEMSALVDAVTECPVPVDVASVHVVAPRPAGEIAHRYRGFADQAGVGPAAWACVLVGGPSGDDGAADAVRLDFFVHRLGLLGFRARPLAPAEFDDAAATEPVRLLARAPGRDHLRRPHLWFTQAADLAVAEPPAQLVGTARDGSPLVMSLPSIPRLDVAAMPDRLPELLLPTLVTGARVGIRTHRPHAFADLLGHGARLVTAAGDPTLDLLVLDGGAGMGQATVTPTIVLRDAHRPAASRPGLPVPELTIGDHAWRLAIGDATTPVRPLPVMTGRGRAGVAS